MIYDGRSEVTKWTQKTLNWTESNRQPSKNIALNQYYALRSVCPAQLSDTK